MSTAINRAFLLKTRTSPTETVDAGEAYFWLEGTAVKYKDDTQTVKTLATGVTPEEVQDIIGAFITSGNNRITTVYNDAGNSFVITLVEANIVHQNLSGAGTNTHAQIDSHISNTSNPHATTAAQVGADPSGSAAAAQAFAIQRSNHTGTQTASTISDFSETAQDTTASMITGATHDGVSVAYNDPGNTLSFTNTDKGTVAIAAHIAAADPHPNYETTTELNARDTANRSRANHTGTQAVGTITGLGALATKNTVATADVDDDAITNLKLAPMAANSIKGNNTGSTADAQDLTVAQTKTLLALDQVNNTTDANKPVSTATQTALNLKYDASNPNGYETPAQLNARDTANRSRANHTGTDLASTISDFTEAAQDAVGTALTDTASINFTYNDPPNTITADVLPAGVNHDALLNYVANDHIDHSTVSINPGTGLTGGGDITANRTLNLANTAVTPGTYGASGVPQFTVDAQGRITAASNGPALVIGDNFEQFSDLTTFTTTANTDQVAATFTTASKAVGLYRIGLTFDWAASANTSDAVFSLYVDGVLQDGERRQELSETATQRVPWSWFTYINFGTVTTHTIQLRTRAETAGVTISVFTARVEIWRVN